jgi:transcription elongation GreA/GreB family factor
MIGDPTNAAEAIDYLRRHGAQEGYDRGGDKIIEAADIIAAEMRARDTVQPGQTVYVQLDTRDGEMVLHAEVTAEGGPRIILREGSKTTLLFERK